MKVLYLDYQYWESSELGVPYFVRGAFPMFHGLRWNIEHFSLSIIILILLCDLGIVIDLVMIT